MSAITTANPAELPEALRLAAWMNEGAWHSITLGDVWATGRELRRLHAENERLNATLSAAHPAPPSNLACAPIPGNFCNWVLKHPTPARDEDGMCVHPALMQTDDEANVLLLLAAYGIRGALVGMEDDAPALYEAYSESGNADCSAWTPTPPAGNGWLLLGVWDTEDGPYALFGREEYSITNSVLAPREPNIDLANLLTGYDLRDGSMSPRDLGALNRQAREQWRNILAAARKVQPDEEGGAA